MSTPTLATIKTVIIMVLLVVTVSMGALLHREIGKVGSLETRNGVLTQQLEVSEGKVLLAQQSCTTGNQIVTDVTQQVQQTNQKVVEMTDKVVELAKETIPSRPLTNETKPNPAAVPSNGRLPTDLVRVLDKSFCSANPNHSSCTPTKPAK